MAIVITAGGTGATASGAIPNGGGTIIASGSFNGASVGVTLSDGGRDAHVHSFAAPGAVRVEASGATYTITVEGGETPSIDVSVL